jgi:hypothetical protein
MLAEFLEADIADIALDAPFPEERLPEAPKGSRALWDTLVTFVRQGLTVRELIRIYGERQTGNGITGTPGQIADFMQEWFEGGAADGFILLSPTLPASLQDFTELVVPELRRRGLFRDGYSGPTLRDHLGLTRPRGRFRQRIAQALLRSRSCKTRAVRSSHPRALSRSQTGDHTL